MPTVQAAGAGETLGENAAPEVTTKFAFDIGRHALRGVPVVLTCGCAIGLQVGACDCFVCWPASHCLGPAGGPRTRKRVQQQEQERGIEQVPQEMRAHRQHAAQGRIQCAERQRKRE